jgi:hypothetical protein
MTADDTDSQNGSAGVSAIMAFSRRVDFLSAAKHRSAETHACSCLRNEASDPKIVHKIITSVDLTSDNSDVVFTGISSCRGPGY